MTAGQQKAGAGAGARGCPPAIPAPHTPRPLTRRARSHGWARDVPSPGRLQWWRWRRLLGAGLRGCGCVGAGPGAPRRQDPSSARPRPPETHCLAPWVPVLQILPARCTSSLLHRPPNPHLPAQRQCPPSVGQGRTAPLLNVCCVPGSRKWPEMVGHSLCTSVFSSLKRVECDYFMGMRWDLSEECKIQTIQTQEERSSA